jgi:hypothetical protein
MPAYRSGGGKAGSIGSVVVVVVLVLIRVGTGS